MNAIAVRCVTAAILSASLASPCAAQEAKKPGWPSPVADAGKYSLLLLDLLEYQRLGDENGPRWDVLGWYGDDKRRLWFKSEGEMRSSTVGEADAQALYGRLATAWFVLQAGGRIAHHFERGPDHTRLFAVLGLQGLAPYRFDVEPALFLSNKGRLSGRFTATCELLQTQRLILQSRFETDVAAQDDRPFGVTRGINLAELGARLRFEVRRQFAPYVGVSYRYESAALRTRLGAAGGATRWRLAFGARIWR